MAGGITVKDWKLIVALVLGAIIAGHVHHAQACIPWLGGRKRAEREARERMAYTLAALDWQTAKVEEAGLVGKGPEELMEYGAKLERRKDARRRELRGSYSTYLRILDLIRSLVRQETVPR